MQYYKQLLWLMRKEEENKKKAWTRGKNATKSLYTKAELLLH